MESAEYPRPAGDGVRQLVDRIRSLEREVGEMRSSLLRQAGMSVEPDLVRFGGAVAIEGTLSLPAGIIDNEALAKPVLYGATWAEEENFSVPTTAAPAEIASCEYTIPEGFSRLRFSMLGTCRVRNSSGATVYAYLGPRRRMADGTVYGGHSQQITIADGFVGTLMAAYIFSADVSPGEVVEFFLHVSASAPLAADPVTHSARTEVALDLTR